MSVEDGIRTELLQMQVEPIAPGLSAAATELARQLDEANGPTAAANAARELRAIMADLRKLAPLGEEGDWLDDLNGGGEDPPGGF